MTVDDVYISFLPLAHILDRMIEEYFFHNGASVGYYHGVSCLNSVFSFQIKLHLVLEQSGNWKDKNSLDVK